MAIKKPTNKEWRHLWQNFYKIEDIVEDIQNVKHLISGRADVEKQHKELLKTCGWYEDLLRRLRSLKEKTK